MKATGVTLLVAVGGGVIASTLGLPVPWLVGALVAVAVLPRAGIEPKLPASFVGVAYAILGVHAGAAVTPRTLSALGEVGAVTGTALSLLIPLSIVLAAFALRRYIRFDRLTSFLAGSPGGIAVVSAVTEGDRTTERAPLCHAVRLPTVVIAMTIFTAVVSIPGAATAPVETPALGLDARYPLLICALVGWLLARRRPFPGARVVLPLGLAAVASLVGWSDGRMWIELVVPAQVVFGAGLGARCAALPVKEARSAIRGGIVIAAILIAVSFATAAIVYRVLGGDVPFLTLVLMYAPGGTLDLTLLAGSAGADVGLVAAHHMVRLAVISIWVPVFARTARRRAATNRGRDKSEDVGAMGAVA